MPTLQLNGRWYLSYQLSIINYQLKDVRHKGRHKIFIGMAPGVGKTYKMLQEAQALKQTGIDVIIGILETHGRSDTARQSIGLEILPRIGSDSVNANFLEMDIDRIIQRQPQLVLVDELAHTNIPGSMREKRYQDVELILDAGIDVYSTVNIQHLESLNDIVAKITGVIVRERIPDRLLEAADEVVLIDVTPETLEERLIDGKIYKPEKIQQSLENFFQRRNLIALRELALRELANAVEDQGSEYPAMNGQYCPIRERILVCISTYPNSLRLLRRGARLANYMNAPLCVLFIANPDRFLSKPESLHLENCEQLCLEFSGRFIRVVGTQIPQLIAEVAEREHITQIVIGESQQSWWKILLRQSFTERVLRLIRAKEIDLHIIATEQSK
jgi:two-component system, OmpR family, sensor histidine kinase KdpD